MPLSPVPSRYPMTPSITAISALASLQPAASERHTPSSPARYRSRLRDGVPSTFLWNMGSM